MHVRVINLATRAEQFFTCSPREAVIAAYAQARHDWNTWQYADRYGAQVVEGRRSVACGGLVSTNLSEVLWVAETVCGLVQTPRPPRPIRPPRAR